MLYEKNTGNKHTFCRKVKKKGYLEKFQDLSKYKNPAKILLGFKGEMTELRQLYRMLQLNPTLDKKKTK